VRPEVPLLCIHDSIPRHMELAATSVMVIRFERSSTYRSKGSGIGEVGIGKAEIDLSDGSLSLACYPLILWTPCGSAWVNVLSEWGPRSTCRTVKLAPFRPQSRRSPRLSQGLFSHSYSQSDRISVQQARGHAPPPIEALDRFSS
jgi:hypothetical protein